jgi:Calx-beta domain-containing protein
MVLTSGRRCRRGQRKPASNPARAMLRFAAVSGVHGANHFVLRRVGANLQLLDSDTGTVLRNVAFARTSGVSIAGADGRVNNTLTLDFSGGSLAVPGGIDYRGGRGGYNVLALRGGRFADEREVARTPHAGVIVLGGTTVHYAQIAPINDTVSAANLTINGTASAEIINVINGPLVGGVQTTQVNSSGNTFELVNFAHKTNVTINGNGGSDTFNLNITTPAAGLTSLALDATLEAGSPVSSTFNVLATPIAVSLVGGGTDTANIGAGSGSGVQNITSGLSISDPSSFIAVNLDDSTNATSSRFVSLSPNGTMDKISGLASSPITLTAGDLANLTLSGGSAGNTFILSGVTGPTNGVLPITLNTGNGVDSTFVQTIATGSSVAIHGQAGNDGVAVSNAGTVQGLLGPVSIDNASSFTNLVIDNSNDTTARAATLTSNGTTDTVSGIAPSAITAKASDLNAFTLDGGSGGNTLTLAGLSAGGTATLNTGTGADTTNVQPTSSVGVLNINGQSGNDRVNLGSAGSVQKLTGAVTVTNGAATTLTLNDASDPTGHAVTVGTTQVSGLAPAQIDYAGVPALTIDGGSPSDTFTVTPSTTTTDTLVGGGPVSNTPPGNTLNMTLTGATSPALGGTASAAGAQGAWTFANRNPVNFSHMQSLNPTALSVGDAATTVGGSGSSPLSFAATLLAASAQPVSASYATADGSATAASGAYTPASGTVSFPAGTTSQTIPVSALGHATVRPPQTLTLALTGPVNAVLARAAATGTITDSFAPTSTPPSVAPVLTHLTQTHTSWREGTALAVISHGAKRRPPVGTSFSFTLNESASITLAFNQNAPGRTTHGHCVAQTKKNRKSRACSRVLTRGTLRMTGHAGRNRISFQGRLSRTRTLKPGRYTLVITAMNAAGQSSRSSALTFTIVK